MSVHGSQASAFTNLKTDGYERAFSLKDSPVRPVFEPSEKSLRGFCRCESLAMALFVRECEIKREVQWIMDEPGIIRGVHDGRPFRYFPDFKVGYRSGVRKIVEIKSARHRGNLELRALFKVVAAICQEQGFEFELIFSDRVYREPKRTNVSLIHYYRHSDVTEAELNELRIYLDRQERASIQGVIAACADLTLPKICALVAKGHLWVNLLRPLNMGSTTRLPRSAS